jgi:hypothetical protein
LIQYDEGSSRGSDVTHVIFTAKKLITLGARLNIRSLKIKYGFKDFLEISIQCVILPRMLEIIECLGTDVFNEQFGESPHLVALLEADFAGVENTSVRHQLIEASDESEFSLRQWVESLGIVNAWLDARDLELAMGEKIGYICCACEAAGAGANLTHLPSLVTEMLEAYGCERAKDTGSGSPRAN